MTRDEIIKRMGWLPSAEHGMSDVVDRIERIVRAAERAERKACALEADGWLSAIHDPRYECDCAAAIRARGQEDER